jgi:hypothetical protein
MAQIPDEKTITFQMLVSEFTRRVVIELNGRRFEYSEDISRKAEHLCADSNLEDVLKVLPEVTREFASRIKPEWCRCHKLSPPPEFINLTFTSLDPISGLSIRGIKHFNPMKSRFCYRFDAAFS